MATDTTIETSTTGASTTGAGPFEPSQFARRDSFRARVESCAQIRALRDRAVGDDESAHGWRRCHLRDLSASGAGVEAVGVDLEPGDGLLVRFDGVGSTGSFQLRGTVVRADVHTARTLYGIRFEGLVPTQVEQLYCLVMTFARIRQRRSVHVL